MKATRDNTRWVRPAAGYRIQAPVTIGGNKLLRFERYVGTADKNDVESLDNTSGAWESLGEGSAVTAADTTGSAVASREVTLQPTEGELVLVRAVYGPEDWRPDLPLTGGTARDWFFILGAIALAAGVGGGLWRRHRMRVRQV